MKRIFSVLLVVILILSFSSFGYAQNPAAKLGRGVANTLTGFWELPVTVIRMCKSDGAAKGLTTGVAKGLVNGIYRTLVGLYEVVTFAIPLPKDYAAITDPPTLLTSETLNEEDPALREDLLPAKTSAQ